MINLIPIDDIRNALQDRRLTVVAEKCGLSHPTVKAIASGNENQPEHMEKTQRLPE